MRIRRIEKQDLEQFKILWNSVFQEGGFLRTAPPSDERILTVIRKVTERKIPQFVAIENNEIVGSVEAFPGTMCGFDSDNTGYVGIQVKKEHRQKGVAKKLLETLLFDSRNFGFKFLCLEVYSDNLVARKLYEAYNFQYTGSTRLVTMSDESSREALEMKIEISR